MFSWRTQTRSLISGKSCLNKWQLISYKCQQSRKSIIFVTKLPSRSQCKTLMKIRNSTMRYTDLNLRILNSKGRSTRSCLTSNRSRNSICLKANRSSRLLSLLMFTKRFPVDPALCSCKAQKNKWQLSSDGPKEPQFRLF